MPKIYLSPARHRPDNPCSFDTNCGENKHNDAYLDELEVYLAACGFEYRRNKSLADGGTMYTAVKESNDWGADLHYVSHTNAFNGTVKGSRPIVYPKGKGKQWAEILLKHRAEIYPYPMKINERTDLYELRSTKAVAIYEEHVFHDNYEDCKWFHENLRNQARQTCKAFCEIFGVPFVDPYRILGDIDNDKRLTVSDVIGLRRLIMSGNYDDIADMTKDGELTVADVIALRRAIMDADTSQQSQPATEKPTLKYGATGDFVIILQNKLSQLGLYYGKIDGIFGALTLDAVRTFQRSRGLSADGIVGKQTWSKLVQEVA